MTFEKILCHCNTIDCHIILLKHVSRLVYWNSLFKCFKIRVDGISRYMQIFLYMIMNIDYVTRQIEPRILWEIYLL